MEGSVVGVTVDLSWQSSLFDIAPDAGAAPGGFDGVCRHELAHGAWVDVVPGWLRGADELFVRLLETTPWRGHELWMYDRTVPEPRVTHRWRIDAGEPADRPEPLLADMATELGERYDVAFTQVGANLYRDGADSVAWHGDRVAREMATSVVALVSLGATRPLRLRPTGGGASVSFPLASGDLLVMGGSCQRTWQHSVPKVRDCGPRISVQFRHAYPTGDRARRREIADTPVPQPR
ncbi:alpha-ketoglutarate-dependent dioxygenase AlkB [Pseudonocardia sp. KRD291]|uniref:alpha-ketoglutarate-dependent dioxygenase AlkB n=1 Tax=Pseudonocardia sp. KRD291 TaxID=2792007 RepID=UPI001C49D7A4|nr:alpha-ketoglutarate-dependent dioxygenase AlkB [Pseudonocardia sp. KRD291]MBW0105051.1 alpha-ketoglutarate-dependent dioxygenase AlkB [Pseudonocardia sp. KRD291]